MASPPRPAGRPVRRIPCTTNMEIWLFAEPGENRFSPGFVNMSHYRRSPVAIDPQDWHRVGAGVRLRVDRLDAFVDALAELQDEAEARGIWRARGLAT
jgi:hypothetical protein